ncbi:MAG: hypothetical protein KC457_09910, partial [Myxococcales bacterium]|nr:hypothetical protein [Myxococcales bacterium]
SIPPARFGAPQRPLERAAVGPDGVRVATRDRRGELLLWTEPGREPTRLGLATAAGRVLEFSPDGAALLVAGADHSLELVRLDHDDEAPTRVALRGHQGPVLAASFSPDGGRIISAAHDYNAYLALLRRDRTMVLVGVPPASEVHCFSLIGKRRSLAGSLIGGIRETQEMLDFCGEHGIAADVELIAMDQINQAYERMLRSDVKYRFVIDLATLPEA